MRMPTITTTATTTTMMMMIATTCLSMLLVLSSITETNGFSVQSQQQSTIRMNSSNSNNNNNHDNNNNNIGSNHPIATTTTGTWTRNEFFGQAASWMMGGTAVASVLTSMPTAAMADAPSIQQCIRPKKGQPANCVSTANVKQVDLYAPPWTYTVSADEAVAALKSVVEREPKLTLVDSDDRYLKVLAERPNTDGDVLEFIVKDDDKVVFFRSAEGVDVPSLSDFGAQKIRLEAIRKRAEIFGVMGEGLTADSYQGDVGNGPLSQLKAFYGLQSGKGFEDVLAE